MIITHFPGSILFRVMVQMLLGLHDNNTFPRLYTVPGDGTDAAGTTCSGGQVPLARDRRQHGQGGVAYRGEAPSQVC